MKKTNLKNAQLLSRHRQQQIMAGAADDETSCTAECGKNQLGQRLVVTCRGSYCFAKDTIGCSSLREAKSCSQAIVA